MRIVKKKNKILYLFVIFFVFFARALYTEPIESGSDPLEKWNYVLNFWNQYENFLLNHHTMRWAVNFWGVLVVSLFGPAPSSYYLSTLLFYSLGYTILFYFFTMFAPRWSYLTFLIFIFYEPMMFRASSQFQPIVFGFTYLTLCYLFYFFWANSKKNYFLFLSAFSLFCAYGAKESYIYFLPGFFLFLCLKNGTKIAIQFFLIYTLFFTIEFGLFNFLSDKFLILGRLSAILSTHIPGGGADRGLVYLDYVRMWSSMSWFNIIAVLLSLGFFTVRLLSKKISEIPTPVLAFCLMFMSYLLCNMTLIVNFDSMLTSQGPFIKYLAVAMPFASFTAIGFLVVKIEELENRTLRKICISSTAIGTSVFITCQLLFGIGPKYTHQHIEYPAGSFYILKIDSQYRQMAQWVEDGNGVYTNSLIKGRTLKSLLGHFVNLNVISLNKVPNHGYLICLSELDLDSLKQIKDYNFSVSDFYSLPIKEWPPRKDQSSS